MSALDEFFLVANMLSNIAHNMTHEQSIEGWKRQACGKMQASYDAIVDDARRELEKLRATCERLRKACGQVAPKYMSEWESGLIAREDDEVQSALKELRKLRAENAAQLAELVKLRRQTRKYGPQQKKRKARGA